MYLPTSEIVKKANRLVKMCGTRDPYKIANELDIEITIVLGNGNQISIEDIYEIDIHSHY